MTLALSDLIAALTPDEALTSLLAIADTLDLATTAWRELGITRTIVATMAQEFSDLTFVHVDAVKGGLLDYATGGWVTLLASNVYGVTRILAAAGTGTITLTNAGGDTFVIAAGDLTFEHETSGYTYRNTTGGTLNPSSTLDLEIIAETTGTAANALATKINQLNSTLLGVTVNNAAALVGTDEEEDEPLRERCRDALGALSPNGAAQAYEYVATSTLRADDSTVDINRVRVSGDTATGVVTVTLASPSGAPVAGDVTLVNTAIQETVVPVAVTANVAGATAYAINVTYTAYVPADAGESDPELEAAVSAALTNYFRTIPIGGFRLVEDGQGYVFVDDIESTISEASTSIFTVVDMEPLADVALTLTQVATIGVLSAAIERVAQS